MTKDLTVKDQNKELIVEQLKKTPIIQAVCEKVNVPRATFYRWRKHDEEFAKKVNEALSQGNKMVNDLAESQLISAIKDRNMTAIIFWLKHHHKNYATKVELSGRIQTETKLSPEQEEEIKRALKLASLYKDVNEEDNNN